jgi:hypothetical protein
MTHLTKPVTRELPAVARLGKRPLLVTLAPEGVVIREKGTRTRYGPVPYGTIFLEAIALRTGKPRLRPRPRRR